MKKNLKIKVFGKVQGVFFRYSAKKKAQELGLLGYAKNMPDGTVEIEAEGEKKNLQIFLQWCKEGSETAEVEKVDFVFSEETKNFKDFNQM